MPDLGAVLVTGISRCIRQAGGETDHAHGYLDYLKDVGGPATGFPCEDVGEMIQAGAQGTPRDYIGMYPGMAIAERAYAGCFQQALDDVA